MARPRAGSRSLSTILSIKHRNPDQERALFMRGLADWVYAVPGRPAIPRSDLPDIARMIADLDELVRELSSSGLFYLIDHTVGDRLASAVRSLRRIGANKSIAYLREFARLFPGGRVPTSRTRRVAAFERAHGSNEDRVLNRLDGKYREIVLREIPDRLRAFVSEHAGEAEAERAYAARQRGRDKRDEVLTTGNDTLSAYAQIRAWFLDPKRIDAVKALGPEPKIGDIIELSYRGDRAYLQVTHRHFYHETSGPVVRVLDGIRARTPNSASLRRLVAARERYFAIFDVRSYAKAVNDEPKLFPGKVTIRTVANLPVPSSAKRFPTFLFHVGKTRDGRNAWRTWRGGEKADGEFLSPLSEGLRNLPHAGLALGPDDIVRNIKRNWRPIDEYQSWGDV